MISANTKNGMDMILSARKGTHYTREKAAEALHVDPRTLAAYELEGRLPSPEMILEMSHLYGRPEMPQKYCRQHCAIGQAFGYEVLDNADKSLPAVILKLMCEMKDCTPALDRLTVMAMSKISRPDFRHNDLTEEEWQQFEEAVQAFLDVEHGIAILRESLGRLMDVSRLVADHNAKCWAQGYCTRKEKDRLPAAV